MKVIGSYLEVSSFYLEVSSFPCLQVSTSFLSLQSYDLGGLSLVAQGVFAPWSPQAGRSPWFPRLGYSNWTGIDLMNSWAQLLLELNPFDDPIFSGFSLPQASCFYTMLLPRITKTKDLKLNNIINLRL